MNGKLLTLAQIKRFVRGVYGNKQDKLVGPPGEVLQFDDEGSVSSTPPETLIPKVAVPNKNILINSHFTNVINQLGQKTYQSTSSTATHSIDGWDVVYSTLTLSSDMKKVETVSNNDSSNNRDVFRQRILSPEIYAGKTLTYSFLISEMYGIGGPSGFLNTSVGLSVHVGTKLNVETPNVDWTLDPGVISLTFTVPDNVVSSDTMYVSVSASRQGEFTPQAAKLEIGDQQTLAYQDDEGKWIEYEPYVDYTTEWLRCARRMLVIDGEMPCCSNINGSSIDVLIQAPVPFFKVPTPIIKSINSVYVGGTEISATNVILTSVGGGVVNAIDHRTYGVRLVQSDGGLFPKMSGGVIGRFNAILDATPT